MRKSCKIHGSEIKKMKVAIKKLDEKAIVPSYGSEYAAGADLYACLSGDLVIPPHKTVLIPTGIAIELPLGYAGLIYARSGLATKKGLAPANKVGVVDCDYRGEVKVALHNHSEEGQTVCAGERIALSYGGVQRRRRAFPNRARRRRFRFYRQQISVFKARRGVLF